MPHPLVESGEESLGVKGTSPRWPRDPPNAPIHEHTHIRWGGGGSPGENALDMSSVPLAKHMISPLSEYMIGLTLIDGCFQNWHPT